MILPIYLNFNTSKTPFKQAFRGFAERLDTLKTASKAPFEADLIVDNRPTAPGNDVFERSEKPLPELKRGQFIIEGDIYIAGCTEMFRTDLNWGNFGDFLRQRFKDENRVNTYIYGCSDGSEAYTMSVLLQEKFKNDAEKFFPIIARDIDETRVLANISDRKNGNVEKYKDAFLKAQTALQLFDGYKMRKYMKPVVTSPIYDSQKGARLAATVTEPVCFECANILEDLESIDNTRPSVVMCRNMWSYIKSDEYPDFANALYERLSPNSVVVIGNFDYGKIGNINFPQALVGTGFRAVDENLSSNNKTPLVFEKA